MTIPWTVLLQIVVLVALVGPIACLDYTPVNPLCGCFQQNAVKTLGSLCFARSAATFGGTGAIKKHDHVKYVVESCPDVTMPYGYGASYGPVLASFVAGSPGGWWYPVTGTAQVGDIVVTRMHMQMITSLGRYPVLLSDGWKVAKRTNAALWWQIKNKAGSTWQQCAVWTDFSGHIDPTSPRGDCSATPWTEQSLPAFTPAYWRIARAAKRIVQGFVPRVTGSGIRVFRHNIPYTFTAVFNSPPYESSPLSPAVYTEILDLGSVFANPTFTPVLTGLYFGSMGAGIQTGQTAAFHLTGVATDIGLSRLNTAHLDPDYISRNLLMSFSVGDTINMVYEGWLYAGTTGLGNPNGWSMCSLDNTMSPLEAVSVAHSTFFPNPGVVTFDTTLVDTSNAWSAGVFTAPSTGLYFFGLSAGLAIGTGGSLVIKQDGSTIQTLKRESTVHNNNDMISTVALTQMTAGSTIAVEMLSGGEIISTTDFLETALVGFHYSPRHGQPVAWSVARTVTWTGAGSDLEPMPFNNHLINEGSAYNIVTDHVDITVSGTYYLHLTLGVPTGKRVSASVKVGTASPTGSDVLRLYRPGDINNGVDIASHGQLVHLKAGDKLWVKADGSSSTYSYMGDLIPITSFTGMLIYKD